ncbi:MAG: alpha-N-arabinofuranosidase, partial [Chloroflexi bacterium]|nr:alpha-N-arabinofuranosidase [Chloroflexota bacterium]
CNGTGNTYWANLRRANGHPEAYNVKYWGLGNEMYGAWQIGATSAADYVSKARQFGAIMKLTDPSIALISCGQWGWTDWDKLVIDGLAAHIRYHSVHLYTGSGDYYRNVLQPHQADRALRVCETLIARARYEQNIPHPIGIAFDEWNVWYRTRAPELREQGLEEQYDLSDVLAVATYLNVFIRHCRSVEIANFAQMVNAIAPIFTKPDGLFLQTIYHPLRLFAEHAQDLALEVFVDSPTYKLTPQQEAQPATPYDRIWPVADLGPFQLLDVTATTNPARHELCVAVVNRSRDEAIAASIRVDSRAFVGTFTAYEVSGADPTIRNSFAQPDAVGVQTHRPQAGGDCVEYTFPAHSVTLLRGQLD